MRARSPSAMCARNVPVAWTSLAVAALRVQGPCQYVHRFSVGPEQLVSDGCINRVQESGLNLELDFPPALPILALTRTLHVVILFRQCCIRAAEFVHVPANEQGPTPHK